MARGARLGRGRPNRPIIILRARAAFTPAPRAAILISRNTARTGRRGQGVIVRAAIVVTPATNVRPARVIVSQGQVRRALPRAATLVRPVTAGAVSYEEITFNFGGLAGKWSFQMLTLRVSSLSRARVEIGVSADKDGLPYDPTSAIAEMAFMTTSLAEPGSGDWKACDWDVTRIGTYVMQCLVGPGGTVALAKGGYYVWARLTDSASGEIPVEQVARMIVN